MLLVFVGRLMIEERELRAEQPKRHISDCSCAIER